VVAEWEVEEIKPEPVTMTLGHRAVVKSDPMRSAPRLGFVVGGTRVRVTEVSEASGCRYQWLQIEPYGWVCARAEKTEEAPSTETLPRLGKRNVPGTYGKVRRGAQIFANHAALLAGDGRASEDDMVNLKKTVRVQGESFWKTSDGEYVASRQVRRMRGSNWEGVVLGEETGLSLPLAFAFSRAGAGTQDVSVYARPSLSAEVVRTLKRRAAVPFKERSFDQRFVRIGDDEWVAVGDVRVAERAELPTEDVLDEAWMDVDLDNQTVVLYRGRTPIYATLTSTGRYKHRTPTGIFRVARKKGTTTMRSAPNEESQYVVERVPWTMYFLNGYAVHGAYWHNDFGREKSHGCVNLAPADAQHIYEKMGPHAPAGWNEVVATVERPGGLVRVRSERVPSPRFVGYAADVERRFADGQRYADSGAASSGGRSARMAH